MADKVKSLLCLQVLSRALLEIKPGYSCTVLYDGFINQKEREDFHSSNNQEQHLKPDLCKGTIVGIKDFNDGFLDVRLDSGFSKGTTLQFHLKDITFSGTFARTPTPD